MRTFKEYLLKYTDKSKCDYRVNASNANTYLIDEIRVELQCCFGKMVIGEMEVGLCDKRRADVSFYFPELMVHLENEPTWKYDEHDGIIHYLKEGIFIPSTIDYLESNIYINGNLEFEGFRFYKKDNYINSALTHPRPQNGNVIYFAGRTGYGKVEFLFKNVNIEKFLPGQIYLGVDDISKYYFEHDCFATTADLFYMSAPAACEFSQAGYLQPRFYTTGGDDDYDI